MYDDGTNFTSLIKNHQLCWVHEIRKYKLTEVLKRIESETLDHLVNPWRSFYKHMKRSRANPSNDLRIRRKFDRITSLKTMVKILDVQLLRTKKNKSKLPLFLKYHRLPLHNNLCKSYIRERAKKIPLK